MSNHIGNLIFKVVVLLIWAGLVVFFGVFNKSTPENLTSDIMLISGILTSIAYVHDKQTKNAQKIIEIKPPVEKEL